jgi:hypothetical protein
MQSNPTKKPLNRKWIMLTALILALIILSSCLLTANYNTNTAPKGEFYVGVEVAYGDFGDLKALVAEVKNYTNLVVLGLPEFSINRTLLDQSCDYIYNSGLSFIVLFTNISQYSGWHDITPAQWVSSAMEKYGDKFVAVYRWDEPGGDQIDHSRYQEVKNASGYTEAAQGYVDVLKEPVQYYQNTGQTVLTADYVLHWFDYKVGYDAVLAEFGWNNSREQQIALVRGATRAYDKDWGAMVTWTYSNFTGSPYIESGPELYEDLVLAYDNGAKYTAVFDYPQIGSAKFGILGQEHLDALKDFWNYMHSHEPANAEYRNVKTAYVLPADYGFGFRSASDSVWGLWSADSQTQRIYSDVDSLIRQKGANFDIVCNYPTLTADAKGRYEELIFWNGTRSNP